MHEFLEKLGYTTIDSEYYTHIAGWLEWYKGKVDSFHKYSQYNGKRRVARERATLKMPKKVCEDWANLLLNEKVEFTIPDSDGLKDPVQKILDRNNFRVKGNQLIELAFALGTGALVEYKNKDDVKIDYIRANMIYPLSWDNGTITECAFGSEKIIERKKCIYLQIHVLENGLYVVKNHLFNKETKQAVPLPVNITPVFYTKSAVPLFQIITPNIVNNVDLDCPMGISVYADAIDVVKAVDLVYDSYRNEFQLGKKRITIPVTMLQMQVGLDEAGKPIITPAFDDNDVEFYAIKASDNDGANSIKEINMDIRSAQHKEGLQVQLNLLSDKCGLGTDRYSYEASGGVKTATEVISEQDTLFQSLKKHELILDKALKDMIRAIIFLSGTNYTGDVKIDFDDSIIHDTNTEFAQNLQLVSAGIMPKYKFVMWWENKSEEDAKKLIAEASADFEGTGGEI